DPSAAQPVPVLSGETTAGVDAALLAGPFAKPVNLAPPGITGATAVGGTLTCSTGSWRGNPPPSFRYAWQRDGAPIPGASASTYVVQSADAGHTLACAVTATNASSRGPATALALSPGVAIPAGSPPGTTTGVPAKPAALVLLASGRLAISGRSTRVRLR